MHTTDTAATRARRRIGILAGWGGFPVEVAQRLRELGDEVIVSALIGHADRRLEELADRIKWSGVLSLGAQMRFFMREKVKHVVFAGKIFKDRILYHGGGWTTHFPDLACIRIVGASFVTKTKDGCDDTLLNALVAAYQKKGMEVLPITTIAPQMLAEEGCLTSRRLTRSQQLDIAFGWKIARQMGGLDIGQSMTVKDQVVLGVEAVEGTDALIHRTGELCPRGGFTLVKVAKPNQDMRFDVPTIGLKTVQRVVRAGGSAIAIEAGRTIIVDRKATLEYANANSITIVAIAAPELEKLRLDNGSSIPGPTFLDAA
ncbi:MAG: UDP-2,3-diacylglucosamine diphosphatase LpxI [Planctomycetales bacterium]|nr:UDP-2,3-diacylglucosamine diphosphatase LpxI [Planctomycetales bacterium]